MFEYILFVHNDAEIRNIFYETFTDLGYKITTTISHRDVLEILKRERPDCIILDPTISDIPALMMLERIRSIDNNIKVIIPEPEKDMRQFIHNILTIIREKANYSPGLQKNTGVQFKGHILVIDDEGECAELIKNYLSRRGYNVDTALSGEEAILKINTTRPDIVFLDIRMQGVDGMSVLKTIKDIDKSIIVIMTTVIEDEKTIKKAQELGANAYLVKPFNLSDLEKTILSETLHHLV